MTARFYLFWQAYPKKAGEDAAYREWKHSVCRLMKPTKASGRVKLVRKVAEAFIIEQAKLFAASDKGRGEYVKEPSNWLKDGCYLDDPETWNVAAKEW